VPRRVARPAARSQRLRSGLDGFAELGLATVMHPALRAESGARGVGDSSRTRGVGRRIPALAARASMWPRRARELDRGWRTCTWAAPRATLGGGE